MTVLKFMIGVLLIAAACLPGCEINKPRDDKDSQDLPKVSDILNRFGPEQPTDADLPEPVVEPQAVYVIERMVLPLNEPMNQAWALVDESVLPDPKKKVVNHNGIRIGVLPIAQLNAFDDAIARRAVTTRMQAVGSRRMESLVRRPMKSQRAVVELSMPPDIPQSYSMAGGGVQVLHQAISNPAGEVSLRLLPHHHLIEPTVRVRSHLDTQYDGRMFHELMMTLTPRPDELIVMGLYWPWDEMWVTVDPDAESQTPQPDPNTPKQESQPPANPFNPPNSPSAPLGTSPAPPSVRAPSPAYMFLSTTEQDTTGAFDDVPITQPKRKPTPPAPAAPEQPAPTPTPETAPEPETEPTPKPTPKQSAKPAEAEPKQETFEEAWDRFWGGNKPKSTNKPKATKPATTPPKPQDAEQPADTEQPRDTDTATGTGTDTETNSPEPDQPKDTTDPAPTEPEEKLVYVRPMRLPPSLGKALFTGEQVGRPVQVLLVMRVVAVKPAVTPAVADEGELPGP